MRPEFNYDGRKFRSAANSPNGDVSGETVFAYRQDGDLVWVEYSGGGIVFGTLIATADARGCLDIRCQHLNRSGELATGVCRSVPELLPDGRIRLRESWRWTSGDCSVGESVVEEIAE